MNASLRNRIHSFAAGALPFAFVSITCGTDLSPCVCTKEFRSVRLFVVDTAGDLEPGVTATITMTRTARKLPYGHSGLGDGVFTVITDREKFMIEPRLGDDVVVDGAKDTRSFHAEFHITVDECLCHVNKASGPDTVVVK